LHRFGCLFDARPNIYIPPPCLAARQAAVFSPETGTLGTGALAAPQAGVDRSLAETMARVLRHPADKVALVLHLSRLAAPAPHAHHLRVAHALMQDCAQRFSGQVLTLPTQDMVLVATMPGAPTEAERAASPPQLRQTLLRLFAADIPDSGELTSFWRLDQDARGFRSFLGGAAASTSQVRQVQAPAEIPVSPRSLLTLEELVARAPIGDMIVQQTCMILDPDRKQPLDQRLKPAARALHVSLRPLNLRPPADEALADPYLRQHFAARLDMQLLHVLQEDLRLQGRLCRSARGGGLPVHVALGLDAILTPGFSRLVRLAREAGARFCIQIPIMQAILGIDQLAPARKLLEAAGFELAIGPVDAAQLGVAAPDRLEPHVVRLTWSQHMADLVGDKQGNAAQNFARIDPSRIILQGVESDQAVVWGQANGITRYQGRYLDMVQAATRMAACFAAANCTLRQCTDRAATLSNAGRTGCLNKPLLDAPGMADAPGQTAP